MRTLVRNLLMMAAVLSVSVSVYAYDFEVDGIYYNIIDMENLTCGVVYGDVEYTGEIEIPTTVTYEDNLFDVVEIQQSAFKSDRLISIMIPNSIISIGDFAFEDCLELKSVTIADGVRVIGEEAFDNCGITTMVIPNSVETIGDAAFRYCRDMKSVTISNNVKTLGNSVFYECSGLTEVIIPNSVETIDTDAFAYCFNLESITLGENVEILGEEVFQKCSNLAIVYCKTMTPPGATSTTFENDAYSKIRLFVPKGTLDDYQTSVPWLFFWIIKERDFGGVDSIVGDTVSVVSADGKILIDCVGKTAIEVFNTNGQLIYSGMEKEIDVPAKGIYIVRLGGQTFKTVVL